MSSGQRFHFQDGAGRAFALPAAPTHDNGVHVHVHYHDQGAMPDDETCGNEGEDCQASRDAGRIRFAARPQSNHMPGGGFADESDPRDFLRPEQADPRQAANLRPNARPLEYRGRVAEPPNYPGRYGELPSANSNRNAGQLGTSVVSGPRGDRPDIGFSGAAMAPGEYDPRTNLSTLQPDGMTLGNHTASSGIRGMRPDGMGAKAATPETADRQRRLLRKMNRDAQRFWARPGDAEKPPDGKTTPGEIPDDDPDDEPSITRHVTIREQPDGSQTIHRHAMELHPPPKPEPTEDRLAIYRRPSPAGTYAHRPSLVSAGGRHGTAAAATGAAHVSTAAVQLNAIHRRFYGC